MIRSMTGFGKAVVKSSRGIVTIEAKTLNHKFFEISAKLPNGLAQFEDKIKTIVHKKIKRGKVYLNIEINRSKTSMAAAVINYQAAAKYKNQLIRLKKALKLKGEIEISQIITLPGVVTVGAARPDSRRIMPTVKKTLKKVLDDLARDRAKEGKALYKDLIKRADNINAIVTHIAERSELSVVRYKNRLINRIKELAGSKSVDRGRIEQEVALFAKNSDISEELTRLKSHLTGFKESLISESEAGKKLDFIAQELHREANTIASKSSDFKISKGVIQIKSDIEKIREQVKNIE